MFTLIHIILTMIAHTIKLSYGLVVRLVSYMRSKYDSLQQQNANKKDHREEQSSS